MAKSIRFSALLTFVLSFFLCHQSFATSIDGINVFTDNRSYDMPETQGFRFHIDTIISDPLGIPGNISSVTGGIYSLAYSPEIGSSGQIVDYYSVSRLYTNQSGSYNITVTNNQGQVTTATSHALTNTTPLPLPQNIQVTNAETLTPTVTFNPVLGADRYNLKIYDSTNTIIYTSLNSTSPSFTVPAGLLKPNQAYYLSPRALDNNTSQAGSPLERRSVGSMPFKMEAQTLFIDFNADTVKYNQLTFSQPGFNEPYSGFKEQVKNYVSNYYAPYGLDVTTTKPTSGNYSTVFIASDASSAMYSLYGITSNTLGIAESIDYGNKNHNDTALVLISHFSQLSPESLAQVVAHEASHIFGLQHVLTPTQMEYPFASVNSTGFGPTYLAEINSKTNTVEPVKDNNNNNIAVNTDKILKNNLGGYSDSSLWDSIKKFIGKLKFSFLSTLYNAEIGIYSPPNGDDYIGPYILKLGTLTYNSELNFELPLVTEADVFFFQASITPDGDYDVFSIKNGMSLSDFGVNLSNMSNDINSDLSDIQLVRQNATGEFMKLDGNIEVTRESVPEPHTMLLLGFGLAGLAGVRRFRK